MKQIPLTRGLFAMVDDEDYEELSAHKWYALFPNGRGPYAARKKPGPHGCGIILMHRLVIPVGDREFIDHVDMNGLNNIRANLRVATRSQNQWNKPKTKRNTSGFKGVCLSMPRNKWMAVICLNGKTRTLGYRDTPQEAHALYVEAAKRLHGDFARTE